MEKSPNNLEEVRVEAKVIKFLESFRFLETLEYLNEKNMVDRKTYRAVKVEILQFKKKEN